MHIYVRYEISKCSDCPFYKKDVGNLGRCAHWRTAGISVEGNKEPPKKCDLLSGDKFQMLDGDLYKG